MANLSRAAIFRAVAYFKPHLRVQMRSCTREPPASGRHGNCGGWAVVLCMHRERTTTFLYHTFHNIVVCVCNIHLDVLHFLLAARRVP